MPNNIINDFLIQAINTKDPAELRQIADKLDAYSAALEAAVVREKAESMEKKGQTK